MQFLIGNTLNYKRSPKPKGAGSKWVGKAADDRVVVGICAVFGNVDAVRDRVAPGAFDDAIALFKAGRSRCRFLWSHNSTEPPTAKILDLKEVGRSQLPPELLQLSDVTGALQVTRQYLTDEYSERVYQGVISKAITEMSFAFNIDAFHYEEDPDGDKIRVLDSLELFDASDVNWGCNPATMSSIKGPIILNSLRRARLLLDEHNRRKLKEARANADFMRSTPTDRLLQQAARVLARGRRFKTSKRSAVFSPNTAKLDVAKRKQQIIRLRQSIDQTQRVSELRMFVSQCRRA